jgi:hypothetical protein|tara:strand:- start:19 stop:363 length:345 start_codon:yes stop_codon:yes gene_type:complete
MVQLYTKIKLYLEDNGKTWEEEKSLENISITQRDNETYISKWEVDGLDKPTDSQLASYESDANTFETNASIDKTRRTQYGSWESQMEMIYKDQKNGTTTFKDHCDKVRSDNPKE